MENRAFFKMDKTAIKNKKIFWNVTKCRKNIAFINLD